MLQATRAALAAEEPRVDRLQAQLKELIAFPQDLQPLSDGVVAAIQEYQRYLDRLRVGGLTVPEPQAQGAPLPHPMHLPERGLLSLAACSFFF